LPFWAALRTKALVRSAIVGINAAVVGILAFALYDPLWSTGVRTWRDALLVAIGLFALMRWSLPPLAIVVAMVTASATIGTG
jgi:chromate transporter